MKTSLSDTANGHSSQIERIKEHVDRLKLPSDRLSTEQIICHVTRGQQQPRQHRFKTAALNRYAFLREILLAIQYTIPPHRNMPPPPKGKRGPPFTSMKSGFRSFREDSKADSLASSEDEGETDMDVGMGSKALYETPKARSRSQRRGIREQERHNKDWIREEDAETYFIWSTKARSNTLLRRSMYHCESRYRSDRLTSRTSNG